MFDSGYLNQLDINIFKKRSLNKSVTKTLANL